MRSKLKAMATAGMLSLCSIAQSQAGSVTQPGELVGLPVGAPLPPGLYFINTADWGCRDRSPEADVCIGVSIPVGVWSTPWQIVGGRLQFVFAYPVVEVGIRETPVNDAFYRAGGYNPLLLGMLAWDLGGGWGFSYGIGAYFEAGSGVAWSDTSLNQRFGLSYIKHGWNFNTTLVWGTHLDDFTNTNPRAVSPCLGRPDLGGANCNPDFINIDASLTKTFAKWEFGPVAYASWDVSDPVPGYRNQHQFAVGGLVGYDFGPVRLQSYVTTDVISRNYDAYDTRGWTRIIIPFTSPAPPATDPLARRR